MTSGRFISLVFLFITASVIWWMEDIISTSHNEALREKTNRPDFYMKGFTLDNYDPDGTLGYHATGQSLIRYPADDSLEVEQLDMQAYRLNRAPLNVRADTARISNEGDHVMLTGAVDINREKHGEDDSLSIKTEKLFLDNERDYVETNKAITISTSKHMMKGIGMQGWLKNEKYRLFSNVRGKHEP